MMLGGMVYIQVVLLLLLFYKRMVAYEFAIRDGGLVVCSSGRGGGGVCGGVGVCVCEPVSMFLSV